MVWTVIVYGVDGDWVYQKSSKSVNILMEFIPLSYDRSIVNIYVCVCVYYIIYHSAACFGLLYHVQAWVYVV